uniref:Uncharacterized protein n=1 Tax=Sarcophilus harrisii TaxID=9305 RepID=A0A7N4P948_SARHA
MSYFPTPHCFHEAPRELWAVFRSAPDLGIWGHCGERENTSLDGCSRSQSLRSMRLSTAWSSSSEYCSSSACVCSAPTALGLPLGLTVTTPARASNSCRTEEKVSLRNCTI